MKKSVYFLVPCAFFLLPFLPSFTWGFFAHKKINQLAVFTLPPEMITFFKLNIDYLTQHATDADRRRSVVEAEAARHYIDMDHYGERPFDSVPMRWKEAVEKYTEDTLKAYGIVPWHVELMLLRLTEAFKEQNIDKILYLSSNIGHYIADAHVPLHTTENYNGQLTNQLGIHGFWESRLPELFSENWNFFTGRAVYVDDPNKEIWKIVKQSFSAKDSVLRFEASLSAKWSIDKKYVYDGRKKTYTVEYAQAYNEKLNGMVERRMRNTIHAIGSFWYTAWVNGGQPDLNRLLSKEVSDSLKTATRELEKNLKEGLSPKGHDDE